MTLDIRMPIPPLSRLGLWGTAKHGKLTWFGLGDGVMADPHWQIELPNGAIERYPPNNGLPPHFQEGFTNNFYWKAPGVAPIPSRSPELAAAEAAAGLEWRNDRINFDWFWIDSTGERWRVSYTNAVGVGQYNVQLFRAAAFGKPPFSTTKLVTIDEPADSALPSNFAALAADDFDMLPTDISRDGSRAIVEFTRRAIEYIPGTRVHLLPVFELSGAAATASGRSTNTGSGTFLQRFDANVKVPVGYVELTLSGTPATGAWSASASVLIPRSGIYGTLTEVDDSAISGNAQWRTWYKSTYNVTDNPDGSKTRTITTDSVTAPISTYDTATPPPGYVNNYLYFNGSRRVADEMRDRVVGMLYTGPTDTPTAVFLDMDVEREFVFTNSFAFPGSRVDQSTPANPTSYSIHISDTRRRDASGTGDERTTVRWTLRMAGGASFAFESSYRVLTSGSNSGTFQLDLFGIGNHSVVNDAWTSTASRVGKTGSEEITINPTIAASATTVAHIVARNAGQGYLHGGSILLSDMFKRDALPTRAVDWANTISALGVPGVQQLGGAVAGQLSFLLRKVNNKSWQFVGHRHGGPAGPNVLYFSPILHPGGVTTDVAPANYVSTAPPWFNSRNPFTGALAISARPVNWV